MDRAVSEHAFVQRIGVLNESVIEQVEAEPAVVYAHPSRLIAAADRVNDVAVKLKRAGRRPSDPSSHAEAPTCGSSENSGQIRLNMRKLAL